MRVSSKVECGIIALVDIAVNSRNNNIVKLNAVSRRNNISANRSYRFLNTLIS